MRFAYIKILAITGVLTVGTAGPASAVMSDDFESGTLRDCYAPVDGRWLISDGALTGRGGKQNVLLVNGLKVTTSDPLIIATDFMIENPAGDKTAMGIFVSYEDNDNYALVRYRGGDINLVQMISRTGGRNKAESLAQAPALRDGVWYRLTIEGDGRGRYEVNLTERDEPGNKVVSGTLPTSFRSTSGKPGFYLSNSARGRFDNFSIEPKK